MIALSGQPRYVTVHGIKTHYVVAGTGHTLLLFHGLGRSVVTWRDDFGPQSKAFRVYAVDLLGHGDSDTILRFVAHFVETLKLDLPTIVGN